MNNNIILQILNEEFESLMKERAESDIKTASEASAIMKYLDDQIANYKGNTSVIKYLGGDIILQYKDLKIVLSPKRSELSSDAQYDSKNKEVKVFNVKIQKSPKLSVEYDKKALMHEIIHHLDITRKYKGDIEKYRKDVEKTVKNQDYKKYYNDPLEFNAHFFEFIMPSILDNIADGKIKTDTNYNEFVQTIKADGSFAQFYNNINDKFKKKFLKRLGALYVSLKDDNSKLKDLTKIDTDNLEQEKKKYSWLNKLWDKLGDY